jgi:tetratricopeptide (TPR) repeat protein
MQTYLVILIFIFSQFGFAAQAADVILGTVRTIDIEKGEEELKRIVIDNKDLPIKDLISDVFRRFSNREVLKDDVAMLSVEISPNYTDFINLVKRANESFDVGEYEKGLDLLEEAYHILPGYKDILIQLAKAAFNIKDYEKAREYIDEYMEFFPDDPEGYYLLAKIERKLGNKDKALSFAQKSIEIDKNYLKGIVFTAICYNDIGDKINSLRYLKIAYTLNPMDTKIKAMIEKLQREL